MANAKNVFNIGIGTAVDTSGLEKGLSDAEKEVLRSSAKQMETFEKAAHDKIRLIQQTEAESIAEVKKSMEEQINAVKSTEGLDKAAQREKIAAIKEAENEKIKLIKNGCKNTEQQIRNHAKVQVKQVQDSCKKQLAALKDFKKNGVQALKDFAKGAAGAMAGLDQVLASIASGPQAWGKLLVDAGKQVISTLNQWGDKAIESASIQDTLGAVIKSTGASAWTTASQLNKLAAEQSKATGRSRDEIAQMQSVLLGFRSVTTDVFKGATAAVMDMAQVMGGDLRGAANMLGKALDAPVQGMSALSRVGFVFTQQQKEMIKELEAAGKHTEAQKVILSEVEGAFAGAATSTNVVVRAQVRYNSAMEEFKKTIGRGWAEAVTGFRNAIADVAEGVTEIIERTLTLRDAQVEVGRLTQEQQDRINELTREIGDLSAQQVDAPRREFNRLQGLIDDINKEIEQITEAAKSANMISEAGLVIYEERLRVALRDQNSLRTGLSTLIEGSAEYEQMRKRLEDKNDEVSRLRQQITYITNLLSLRREEARAAGEAESAEEAAEAAERERAAQAAKFREENQKALDAEIEKILLRAKIEGKSADDLEVKKQILDANVQAYINLLTAAEAYLSAEEKSNITDDLHNRCKAYQRLADAEKFTDEQRKKNFQELASRQQELAGKLRKIYEDAMGEAKRRKELAEEKRHQDKIAELRKTSVKEAAEYEENIRREKLQKEHDDLREQLDKEKAEQLDAIDRLEREELEKCRGGAEQKLEIERRYLEKRAELHRQYNQAVLDMRNNLAADIREAAKETGEAVEKSAEELKLELIKKINEYLGAAQQIASGISATWHNVIDYQLNEDLRANDAMIQSDEERAKKEKELMMEAAQRKYEADMFAWAANVTLATAQAAMMVMKGWLEDGPGMAVVAGLVGAAQVAAVASAIPKRPRFSTFHEGGVVQGRAGQEVPATLMAGEKVLTQTHFANTMEAISNLASMKTGSGDVRLNLKIENNAGDVAQARFDPDAMRVTIEKVTADAIRGGRMNSAFAEREYNLSGANFQ